MAETAFVFACRGDELPGILHHGAAGAARGLLLVVGGPQYRVGSHRQFVLLARDLAAAGIPVLRFDYRGMGDAGGDFVGFEGIDADIAAALDAFFARCPGLREVVLWGLCDAASASLFYAWRDPRVKGLVLLNPWVRSDAGIARTYLRHYYLARLVSPGLWRKVLRGEFQFTAAARSLLEMAARAAGRPAANETDAAPGTRPPARPLAERVADAGRRFSGPMLLILSGDDLTAAEFRDAVRGSRPWRRLLRAKRVSRRELAAANHTFSRREWRDQVMVWTRDWLKSW